MTTARLLIGGGLICLAIYLFVSAPPELPDTQTAATDARTLDVEKMFNAVNAVNAAARQIYTARIVGAGKAAGLKFGEDWQEPGVEKGPLPALFLRLVAARMETKPARLGLYLGSDAPINRSNLFEGAQAESFALVRDRRGPVFSTTDAGAAVAMYPDFASAMPCVTCHNEHADSPRKDWKLDDVMGATTWTYPRTRLGAAEYLDVTEAVFESVEEAYRAYLDKAAGFSDPVPAGTEWPAEGRRVLPDAATFMAEVRKAAANNVVEELILAAKLEAPK